MVQLKNGQAVKTKKEKKMKKTNGIGLDKIYSNITISTIWRKLNQTRDGALILIYFTKFDKLLDIYKVFSSVRFDCAAVRCSARHHAAESGETPLPLSDQRVRSQIQQAAVIWNKQAVRCQTSLCHSALQSHQVLSVSFSFFYQFLSFFLSIVGFLSDIKLFLHRIQYKSIKQIKMIVELSYEPCFCISWHLAYHQYRTCTCKKDKLKF